jgi:hypothetical protein
MMAELTWEAIKAKVLEKEPNAAAVLVVIEKYWGDGKLTQDLATRFVEACSAGNYVAAQKLIYGQASAAALLEADQEANLQLKKWVEQETKMYNFLAELQGKLIQIALGCALVMVGL